MRRVLTINGGSSSIKFALFEQVGLLKRLLTGEIERIGLAYKEQGNINTPMSGRSTPNS